VPAIVDALRAHGSTSSEVAQRGVGTLGIIAGIFGADVFVGTGGMHAIVATLRTLGLRDADVAECCCSVLYDVAREGGLFAGDVMDAGGVPAIVGALRAHGGTSVEVAQYGCDALGKIAAGDDACTQAVVDAGGVPAIVAALCAHGGTSVEVAQYGCDALRA